jgi:hypothetical protein
MACPRLGKVDRRLVQARHSLFERFSPPKVHLANEKASKNTPGLKRRKRASQMSISVISDVPFSFFRLLFPCPDAPRPWHTPPSPLAPITSGATWRIARPLRPTDRPLAADAGGSVRERVPRPEREQGEDLLGAAPFGALAHGQKTVMCQGLMMRQTMRHLAHHPCQLAQMSAGRARGRGVMARAPPCKTTTGS